MTKFYTLLEDDLLTNLPDMTSQAPSSLLQNATKYSPKGHKRVRPDEESNNSTTV